MGQLKKNQAGMVLVMALIALVVLTLAGIALVRSGITGNLIAENRAYKLGAVQASDIGTAAAFAYLGGTIAANPDTAVTNVYFPTEQPLKADGSPVTSWQSVPTVTTAGYGVQYVIERLCTGALPIADISTSCMTANGANQNNGSKQAGRPTLSSGGSVYYRITVKVSGPKNTVSLV
jgi:Tfp pilus assembly protein PilX